MEQDTMLGVYDNFPSSVHNTVDFYTSIAHRRLQTALVEALYKLNSETLTLEEVTTPSIPECRVNFEVGIGEECGFNYLDDEEKQKIQKEIRKKARTELDFLCILRYHRSKDAKTKTLKSDHYMVRFAFGDGLFEVQIFYVKGLMYVLPKDLPEFFAKRINSEFPKKVLRSQTEP